MEKSNIKEILNDVTLLRFVKKHTANNLQEDNKVAEKKFNLTCGENSLSILDKTHSKLLVTNADFEGEIFTQFSIKQLQDLLDTIGKVEGEGELLIPAKSDMKEMLVRIGNDICVVCPLPAKEKEKKK